MPNNYELVINDEKKYKGRFIGFASDEECSILRNNKEAAAKIATHGATKIRDWSGQITENRAIFVTRDLSKERKVLIIISPKVKRVGWIGTSPLLQCESEETGKYINYKFKDLP
jgi:hypothetical protein